jgi:hypothetical protein
VQRCGGGFSELLHNFLNKLHDSHFQRDFKFQISNLKGFTT